MFNRKAVTILWWTVPFRWIFWFATIFASVIGTFEVVENYLSITLPIDKFEQIPTALFSSAIGVIFLTNEKILNAHKNNKKIDFLTEKIESLELTVLDQHQQKELEKIGIKIIIDVIPGSALKQAKANGKLNFFRASWIADYPDAENYLSLFYSKNFAPNGPNYTHFSDYEYDQIYENSLKETDPEKSKVLYEKMDSIVTVSYTHLTLPTT